MKLYEVSRNTRIKFQEYAFNFHHVDGMYSYCTDDMNNAVHLSASAEVEIIEERSSRSN